MMVWIANLDYAASGTPETTGPGATGSWCLLGVGRMVIWGTLIGVAAWGGVL